MAKQEIKQRETQVATGNGVGKELERIYTVDDNSLPSPSELLAYKQIDPRIVDYLITSSEKEQNHRHQIDKDKMLILKKESRRGFTINWWGMCFAFLAIVVMTGLIGYALYLDKPWFAGILGGGALLSIASIFVKTNDTGNKKRNDRK